MASVRGKVSPFKPIAYVEHPSCKVCKLFEDCRSPFMRGRGPEIEKGAKYLIITEYPDDQDDRHDCPASEEGDKGYLLKETLRKFNKGSLEGMVFTCAVRCAPPGGKLNVIGPVNCCRGFLEGEIENIRPDAILMVGARSLQSLFKQQGITKVRREILQYKVAMGESIPCIAAFSPGYALRDANQLPAFEGDIQFFCQFIQGKGTGEKNYDAYVKDANLNANSADIRRMHKRARKGGYVTAIDVETNSLRPELKDDFRITTFGIYNQDEFLVAKLDTPTRRLKKTHPLVRAIDDFLTDPKCFKDAHNAKYELQCWRSRFGTIIEGLGCTQVLHSILHPYLTSRKLEDLGQQYVGVGKDKALEDYFKKVGGKSDDAWLNVPWPILSKYNAGDARLEYDVGVELYDQLEKADALWEKHEATGIKPSELYETQFLSSMYLLQDIEQRGLLLDTEYMKKLRAKKVKRMEEIGVLVNELSIVQKHVRDRITKEIKNGRWKREETQQRKYAEATFNINSEDQVRQILFDPEYYHLEYDKRKTTPSGEPQVDKEVIANLLEEWDGHPIAEFCKYRQEYAALDKDVGTYIDGLTPYQDKKGYVHTRYSQDVATTGRLSSRAANLQNQKKKGGAELRKMFISPPGYDLVELDYSQIELRILGAYSKDQDLIDIYRRGEDLHAETLSVITKMGVFDSPRYQGWDEKDRRGLAKNVNFGIVYGISAYGLSVQLDGEDQDVCQNMIDAVFRRFPGLGEWQDEIKFFAAKYGRVYTMFGNWRELPNARIIPRDGNREDSMLVAEAQRQAINMPVQGTASKCTEVAAAKLNAIYKKRRIPAKIVNLIHDAIFLYAKQSRRDEAIRIAVKVMEREPLKWIGDQLEGIPLVVDYKYGSNWAELKEVV